MLARVIWILVHRDTHEPVNAIDGACDVGMFVIDAEEAAMEAARQSEMYDIDCVAAPHFVDRVIPLEKEGVA